MESVSTVHILAVHGRPARILGKGDCMDDALSRNCAFFLSFLLTWSGMAGSAGSADRPEGAALRLGCSAEASPERTAATVRCLAFAFWTSLFT